MAITERGKYIDQLPLADEITSADLMVIAQNGTAKKIPAAQFIPPGTAQVGTVTFGTTWSASNPHTQTVTADTTITSRSVIALCPTDAQMSSFAEAGVKYLRVDNEAGVLTAVLDGEPPAVGFTMDCLIIDTIEDSSTTESAGGGGNGG